MSFLSIIVPTLGNPELYYTLLSCKDQMRPMDELIVVAIEKQPQARKIFLGTVGNRANAKYLEALQGEVVTPQSVNATGVRILVIDEGDLLQWRVLDYIRDLADEYPTEDLYFREVPVYYNQFKKTRKRKDIDRAIIIHPWQM